MRLNWDDYFIEIAEIVAKRATCPRANVGAVIVANNRILTTGYNGSLPGMEHCLDVGCLMVNNRCIKTVHAETNAILQGAKFGISLLNSTLYCTHYPCENCAKLIISAGIEKVFYKNEYYNEISEKFFKNANVKIVKINAR